jgi:hypothetical protein
MGIHTCAGASSIPRAAPRSATANRPPVVATDESTHGTLGFRFDIVEVNMLVDEHNVTWQHLARQVRGDCRQKPLVEVVPDDLLLKVRVHAREWRWHRDILQISPGDSGSDNANLYPNVS